MTELTTYNSRKIRNISFFLIVLVIFTHSGYEEAANYPIALFVQEFVGKICYLICNSSFFAISGFLFFYGVHSVSDCWPKIRRRFTSLLVPYIIWNCLIMLGYWLMSLCPVFITLDLEVMKVHFESWPMALVYTLIHPAGFHLWFIRNLVVFVALSPIFYYLLRKTQWMLLIVVFFITPLVLHLTSIRHFDLLFFLLGGYFVLYDKLQECERISGYGVCALIVLMLTLTLVRVLNNNSTSLLYVFGTVIISLIGLLVVWRGYDFVTKRDTKGWLDRLHEVARMTFFVYLFHEPAYNVVKKLGFALLGEGEITLLFLYFVNPFIMVLVSLGVGKGLQRVCPKVYSILVGGR